MSKASTDALDELHGLLAEKFAEKLKSGEASASDLNVIRQFLKDNGIEATDLSGSRMKNITDALPFPTAIPGDIAANG